MAGILSFLLSCIGQNKDKEKNIDITIPKFKVGQVWKYKNRIGEDNSKVTILKIEKYDKGDTIMHIRVDGVNFGNSNSVDSATQVISHLPFSQKSIELSLTELIDSIKNVPDFSEGYKQWRQGFDAGKAGYWTVELKEAIEGMHQAMKQNNK
ncbi:MAG: hypothetical protein V4580_19905 [Bacteroidota bacterium]